MTEAPDRSRLLRASLRANGVFSLLFAVLLLAADGLVAALLRAYDELGWIHLVGIVTLALAILLFVVASRPEPPRAVVLAIVAADLLWVVASWLAIGLGAVTGQGAWAVGIVADLVLLFAILQAIGLRRLPSAGASGARA